MALTFTDRNEKVVLHSWGRFRATLYVAVVTGDVLGLYSSTTSSLTLADDSSGPAAIAVACENIAAGGTGWCALAGEFKAPVSVGSRGAVTRTYFDDGSDKDIGQPLYLDEDGKVEDDIGSTTKQLCGYQIARDRILLCPGGMVTGAGAFTTISASSAVSFDTTLSVAGVVTLADTTESTTSTTGGLIIAAGVGIAKDLFVGVDLDVVGVTTLGDNLTIDDGDLQLGDDDYFMFGDGSGGDIAMRWQGSYFHITQKTANSEILWGVNGAGIDQTWYGDTAGAYMRWDQSQDRLEFVLGGHLFLGDSNEIQLGNDNDITITWQGSYLHIEQATANSEILWGVNGAGIDQTWFGDTTGAYMRWDQSQDQLKFVLGSHLHMGDNNQIRFGTGADIAITWEGSWLRITQDTANSEILWGVNGAGIDQTWYGDTANAYMRWDQSADTLKFVNTGLMIDGNAGVTQTYASSVTGITIVKGIVTAVTGS